MILDTLFPKSLRTCVHLFLCESLTITLPCSRVAEALYANVPGAQLVTVASLDGQVWQLPCDKEVNVTFKFAGVSYPMHPLDTNIDLNMTDGKGKPICFGAVRAHFPRPALMLLTSNSPSSFSLCKHQTAPHTT